MRSCLSSRIIPRAQLCVLVVLLVLIVCSHIYFFHVLNYALRACRNRHRFNNVKVSSTIDDWQLAQQSRLVPSCKQSTPAKKEKETEPGKRKNSCKESEAENGAERDRKKAGEREWERENRIFSERESKNKTERQTKQALKREREAEAGRRAAVVLLRVVLSDRLARSCRF